VILNHAGFAVKDLEQAISLYEKLGFTLARRFEKPEPKAHVASMKDRNGVGLELWQFAEEHPLNSYIGSHVAFMCDNVRADAKTLADAGFKEVISYTEGIILNYIFVQDEYGTTFELAEEKR
jgi:catechol 2,3-dioxygenase-like lactoylglutathione lyase family enzyme